MSLLVQIILALSVMIAACGGVAAQVNATDRGLRFVMNLYTGVPMAAEDWLAREADQGSPFLAHGGLSALVKQSTAFAHRYGGIEAIALQSARDDGERLYLEIGVRFRDDAARRQSNSLAEREEIVWRLNAVARNGNWLFRFE